MPSRATMLTGQYPWTHGLWTNGVCLPRDEMRDPSPRLLLCACADADELEEDRHAPTPWAWVLGGMSSSNYGPV